MDAPRAARPAVAARPPGPRAPARFPFASSTAPRRAGWWWCPRDPRADSSGGGNTFPSPGRCSRLALALAHRNRRPAANLGLPPHRPARSPAAGIATRVTGDGGCDCDGPPLVECAGDRPIQEPAGGQSRHVSASLLPRLLIAVSVQCAAPLADRGTLMRVDWAEFQIQFHFDGVVEPMILFPSLPAIFRTRSKRLGAEKRLPGYGLYLERDGGGHFHVAYRCRGLQAFLCGLPLG